MKRICVAGVISSNGQHSKHILLGRRNKEPNKGMFVLPGGGVEDGEVLEDAFAREVKEETGLKVKFDADRWHRPYVVELLDRIILIGRAVVDVVEDGDDIPTSGSDLVDVDWHSYLDLPNDISPVVKPVLNAYGFRSIKK